MRKGNFPQIGNWYQAEKWLTTQTPATFILDDGAGRLRQFGRMAIFKDLQGQETNSKIWDAIRVAIEGVRAMTSQDRRLEIIIVGSFAGGTGSGMFIDIALIARFTAVKQTFIMFYAVILPYHRVHDNPDKEMRARSFAAWRELNRFMVVSPDFPMHNH